MDTKTRDFPDQEKQDHMEHQDASSTDHTDHTDDHNTSPPRVNLERVPTYLQPPLSIRQRVHHFTFAWYTLT